MGKPGRGRRRLLSGVAVATLLTTAGCTSADGTATVSAVAGVGTGTGVPSNMETGC